MLLGVTAKKGINDATPDADLMQERLNLLNADLDEQKIIITENDKINEAGLVSGTITIISIPSLFKI